MEYFLTDYWFERHKAKRNNIPWYCLIWLLKRSKIIKDTKLDWAFQIKKNVSSLILLRGGWGRLIDLVNGPQARFWGQKSSLFERNQLDKKIKEVESSKFQPNWSGMWIREKIEFWQIEASLSWNGKYSQCSEPNELYPSSLLPKKLDVFIKEGRQLINSWYEILVKYKLERKI